MSDVLKMNMESVVIAEDNRSLRSEMSRAINSYMGWQVWATERVRTKGHQLGIIELARQSHAYWYILDICLADGASDIIIPELRRLYDDNVYIIVVTANESTYPIQSVLGNGRANVGADLMFNKPYDVLALIQQLTVQYDRQTGRTGSPTHDLVLAIGDYLVDVSSGMYYKKDNPRVKHRLNESRAKFLKVLSSKRKGGEWTDIMRSELIFSIWGQRKLTDKSIKSFGERLRHINLKLKEIFEVDDVWVYLSGVNHSSNFKLHESIEIVNPAPEGLREEEGEWQIQETR